jgi:hypothetical protein
MRETRRQPDRARPQHLLVLRSRGAPASVQSVGSRPWDSAARPRQGPHPRLPAVPEDRPSSRPRPVQRGLAPGRHSTIVCGHAAGQDNSLRPGPFSGAPSALGRDASGSARSEDRRAGGQPRSRCRSSAQAGHTSRPSVALTHRVKMLDNDNAARYIVGRVVERPRGPRVGRVTLKRSGRGKEEG